MAEGTVLTSVTCEAAWSVGSSSAFSLTTTLPPRTSGANSSKTERSKQMEVEARTPASSSSVKTSADQRRKIAALACAMATPFGGPVEPDV